MKLFEDKDLKGRKVIVRVDFNVPLDSNQQITDDTRIRAALPTIQFLLNKGSKVILISHLGRPLKDLDENGLIKSKYSLAPVSERLSTLLGKEVRFIDESIHHFESLQSLIDSVSDDDVILLENIRYYKGEEKGDAEFAKTLSRLGDYYVNDSFGAAHREHASTATMARFYDSDHKSFGFLMEKEVSNIGLVLNNPSRPFTAIVGGAKVSDKILVIENLIDKVDKLIIGGGMAFTFIKANGGQIGNSLCEADKMELALHVQNKAKEAGVELILPVDARCADSFSNTANIKIEPSDSISDGWSGLDIGPESEKIFSEAVINSKTILWNGPMGVFEFSSFANGTLAIAEAMSVATSNGAYTLVGGGDSVAAINQAGKDDEVSFVSTGGGAMLEMIEGKELPGVSSMF